MCPGSCAACCRACMWLEIGKSCPNASMGEKPSPERLPPGNFGLTRCFTPFFATLQSNTALQSITINGKLSLVEFRDGKTQTLDLSRKGFEGEEAIIIAALLEVCVVSSLSAVVLGVRIVRWAKRRASLSCAMCVTPR